MESAVVLATFSLIAIVIIYVVLVSSSLTTYQQARITEKQVSNDAKKLFTISEGVYRSGWSSDPTSVNLHNEYDIKVGEKYITLYYGTISSSETGPVPFVPTSLNDTSVVNVSYVVYNGTGHINLTQG